MNSIRLGGVGTAKVGLKFETVRHILGGLSESIKLWQHRLECVEGKMERENAIHVVGAKVSKGAVHPCRSNCHGNQRGHHEHLCFKDA
jgi:hypothetical protein